MDYKDYVMAATRAIETIPTPTEEDYALARSYLIKHDALDIVEILGL